jgi:hypothetical protein
VLVELIFAMILTLELVPEDVSGFRLDVLQDAELSMQVTAEREDRSVRFADSEGNELLVVERAVTAGHVYTAFPADEDPAVYDTSSALDALRPFETAPRQTIQAAATAAGATTDWTIAAGDEVFYLGVPSARTVLVIHTELAPPGEDAGMSAR